MLKKLVLGAAALAFCIPAASVSAQSFGYYFDQAQGGQHDDFHEQEAIAHAEAHERGFSSPEQHEAWHQNAERAHELYHQDHAYGDGGYYGGWRASYGGYYPYRAYYPRHRYYRHRYYRPRVHYYRGY